MGPEGVRVNCVAPGLVRPISQCAVEDEERLKRRCATSLAICGRSDEPDVKYAVRGAYLGSDRLELS